MSSVAPSFQPREYRGATVEDLDPPPALSIAQTTPIHHALLLAYERDYTHLTIIAPSNKALLGYISMPRLRAALTAKSVGESDPVSKAMLRFHRGDRGEGRRKAYQVITMATPLEELEEFFEGGKGKGVGGDEQDFAVVTDEDRRFVLGVVTREDLKRFVERRPV